MPRLTIILDCADPQAIKDFWRAALDYIEVPYPDEQYVVLANDKEVAPVFALQRVPEPKPGKNRMHIDIHAEDLDAEIERLVALGATVAPQERMTGPGMAWQTMLDPEGNEFCVVSP